ncbi:dienelactone hydrolase family protein [Actinacidiphila sp. bgisy160]|uniref:dienelactone hydrolase family protein n=1 Tax=Actinacidiphila sp. bgisy160 TaxID=3413796 RepID=UPI003D751685
MIGHLALPAAIDRRPAVLLGPEGMGLSDVERRRADALAELGCVALAFDLHGRRYLGDPEEMLARCMPLLADPDRMRRIGHAALNELRTEPRTDPDRIAAVGYHPQHAQRAWRDVVDLLAECLPVTEDLRA